jgi:hypothetical protein
VRPDRHKLQPNDDEQLKDGNLVLLAKVRPLQYLGELLNEPSLDHHPAARVVENPPLNEVLQVVWIDGAHAMIPPLTARDVISIIMLI